MAFCSCSTCPLSSSISFLPSKYNLLTFLYLVTGEGKGQRGRQARIGKEKGTCRTKIFEGLLWIFSAVARRGLRAVAALNVPLRVERRSVLRRARAVVGVLGAPGAVGRGGKRVVHVGRRLALAVARRRAGWWLDLVTAKPLLGVLGSAGRRGTTGGWSHRLRLLLWGRGLSSGGGVRTCREVPGLVGVLDRGGGGRRWWLDVGRGALIRVGDRRLMRELRHRFGVLVLRRAAKVPRIVLLVAGLVLLLLLLLLAGELVLLLEGSGVLLLLLLLQRRGIKSGLVVLLVVRRNLALQLELGLAMVEPNVVRGIGRGFGVGRGYRSDRGVRVRVLLVGKRLVTEFGGILKGRVLRRGLLVLGLPVDGLLEGELRVARSDCGGRGRRLAHPL